MKNRVHQELESCSIKLSSVLSDSFGKSDRYILDGLTKGLSIEEILAGLPSKKVRTKQDQIREVIKTGLDQLQLFLIGSHLDTIDNITKPSILPKRIRRSNQAEHRQTKRRFRDRHVNARNRIYSGFDHPS
jgi:transposase